MRLNTLSPAIGSNKARKRVGRGQGSGVGKTAGRGVKGQKSRSGGYHKVGFEGGQMPLYRRLPKRGFRALRQGDVVEIRLHELAAVDGSEADLDSLKNAKVIPRGTKGGKIVDSGEITRAITIRGLGVTKGARGKIEQAGGKIED